MALARPGVLVLEADAEARHLAAAALGEAEYPQLLLFRRPSRLRASQSDMCTSTSCDEYVIGLRDSKSS